MAIDRHKFTKIHIKQNKGKCWNTTILPIIEKSFNDRFIFTRDGDRLDNLAFEFYGDPRFWIILAIANHLGKGTTTVHAGLQLRIPPKSIITDLRLSLDQVQKDR